jgi:hypothetical protein
VQDPAGGEPGAGGEVEPDVAVAVEVVPFELGLDVVEERWQRRVRVQPADPVAAQGRHHLGHHRVAARLRDPPL